MNIIYLKQIVEKAIKDVAYIKIDYVSKDMKITRDRVVKPLEIKFIDKIVPSYFVADSEGGLRNFMFDGIQKIEVLQE